MTKYCNFANFKSGNFTELWKVVYKITTNLSSNSIRLELRATQKRANLADIEKMQQNESFLAKFGFDTAENEPRQVCSMFMFSDL